MTCPLPAPVGGLSGGGLIPEEATVLQLRQLSAMHAHSDPEASIATFRGSSQVKMLSAEPQARVASTQVLFPPSQVTTHGPPPHSNRAVRHAELPSQEIVQSRSLGQRIIVSRHALLPSHTTTHGLPAGHSIVSPWQVPLPSQLNMQPSVHSTPPSGSLQRLGAPLLDSVVSGAVLDPLLESAGSMLVEAPVDVCPDVSVDSPEVVSCATASPGSPSHSGFALRHPSAAQHTSPARTNLPTSACYRSRGGCGAGR